MSFSPATAVVTFLPHQFYSYVALYRVELIVFPYPSKPYFSMSGGFVSSSLSALLIISTSLNLEMVVIRLPASLLLPPQRYTCIPAVPLSSTMYLSCARSFALIKSTDLLGYSVKKSLYSDNFSPLCLLSLIIVIFTPGLA